MSVARTLVIASGETTSNALDVSRLAAISIQSPTTLTGTITVQGSNDGGSTWDPAYSDGGDITIPADKVVPLTALPFDQIRLLSGSAEGDERTFLVGIVKRSHS